MRFFYENNMCDRGYFSEENLVKAIYAAWNIEASLYLLKDNVKKIDPNKYMNEQVQLTFSPWDDNEFNSDLLKEFGYKMVDGKKEREIVDIKTDKVIKYDWSEVKQLV